MLAYRENNSVDDTFFSLTVLAFAGGVIFSSAIDLCHSEGSSARCNQYIATDSASSDYVSARDGCGQERRPVVTSNRIVRRQRFAAYRTAFLFV